MKVYIQPADQTTIGPVVSVDVMIEDAVDLGGYSLEIHWDASVLSLASITNATFLGSSGRTVLCAAPTIDADHLLFACSTAGPQPGANGNGVLATLVFSTLAPGKSPIVLADATITRVSGESQKAERTDGSVTVEEPTPTPTPTSTPTPSQVVVALPAAQDARVIEINPDLNLGTNPHLNVDPDGSQRQRSFISFDLSSIPAGATIADASLTLCYATPPLLAAIGRQHDLIAVTSSWAEADVTWNSQPAVVAEVTDTINVPLDGCVTFNVTSDVQSWIDGASNFGWRICDQNEGGLSAATSYASRDSNGNAIQPVLTLQYLAP